MADQSSDAQLGKLRDANERYKSLLKMAKERIQKQDEEIERLREESKKSAITISEDASTEVERPLDSQPESENDAILRVVVCIKLNVSPEEDNEEIHALLEYESGFDAITETYTSVIKRWKNFSSEAEFADYVRRDTGEPIILPPFSLSPEESHAIQEEAHQAVIHITEEFRRYRVRSEVARKQADATVRALHSNNVTSTKNRIEGQDLVNELASAKIERAQVETLKREISNQEVHWKKAYDILLAENIALKSSGAEALLAAQWRHRYETCLRDKENLDTQRKMLMERVENFSDEADRGDVGKYHIKYKELKESFRSYRKKAKEIFQELQQGNNGLLSISDRVVDDAKNQYLRNLMVHYLTSESAIRDHMELAIGTVLKFSEEEKLRIEKSREEVNEAWFWTTMSWKSNRQQLNA